MARWSRRRSARPEDASVYTRKGHTGERVPGTIGFASSARRRHRSDHTVLFAAPASALRSRIAARAAPTTPEGSLPRRALHRRPAPGLYGMTTVLALKA